jgi:hypothetical protein
MAGGSGSIAGTRQSCLIKHELGLDEARKPSQRRRPTSAAPYNLIVLAASSPRGVVERQLQIIFSGWISAMCRVFEPLAALAAC